MSISLLTAIGITYFAVIAVAFAAFVAGFKRFRLSFVSYSTLSYATAFVVGVLPGFWVASGYAFAEFYPHLSRGFDGEILMIYVGFALLMPAGFFLGRYLASRGNYFLPVRSSPLLRVILVLLGVSLYSAIYLYWLPENPLNMLIRGASYTSLAISRSAVTHGLGASMPVPMIFGYWRPITHFVPIFLFLFFLVRERALTGRRMLSLSVLFIFVSYMLLSTLEKSGIIYLFVSVPFALLVAGRVKLSPAVAFSVVAALCVAIVAMFYFSTRIGLLDLPVAILKRLSKQTCSIYDQIEYVRREGFLFFDNLKVNYVNEAPVNLSRWTYGRMYEYVDKLGLYGSAGGLSLATLYFSFSYFGYALFFGQVAFFGFLDGVFLKFIKNSPEGDARHLHVALYAAFCSYFLLAMTSDVFFFIQFPLGMSRFFYPLAAMFLFLFKVEGFRFQLSSAK